MQPMSLKNETSLFNNPVQEPPIGGKEQNPEKSSCTKSRMTRKEMLERWQEEKKRSLEARKTALNQEPARFQNILRNNKIALNSSNKNNQIQKNGSSISHIDMAKRPANKENINYQILVGKNSISRKSSPIIPALNLQKNKNIHEPNKTKSSKFQDQGTILKPKTNASASGSPFIQRNTPKLMNKSRGNCIKILESANDTLMRPTNNTNVSQTDIIQLANTKKCVEVPEVDQIDCVSHTLKENPYTKAETMPENRQQQGDENLPKIITQTKPCVETEAILELTAKVEGLVNPQLKTEEVKNLTNNVILENAIQEEASEKVIVLDLVDTTREQSELEKTQISQIDGDERINCHEKQEGCDFTSTENSRFESTENFQDLFDELYKNYRLGLSYWKSELEKLILTKDRKLTHFCILEGRFKPSDEIGEQLNKHTKFWVLFIKYIQDRAVNEQEYRLYEIILSQNGSLVTLLNELEGYVDAEDSFKTEETCSFLSSAIKLPKLDNSGILLTPTLTKIKNLGKSNSNRNQNSELKGKDEYHGNKFKPKAADSKNEQKVLNETKRSNKRKRSRIKMEEQRPQDETQEGHQTKKIKTSKTPPMDEARVLCSNNFKNISAEDQFGSIIIYEILSATKKQQKKYGSFCNNFLIISNTFIFGQGKEKILTPVRSSRRIQIRQQRKCFGAGGNRKTLNFVDLDQIEETNCIYVDNPSLGFLFDNQKHLSQLKLE